MTSIRNQRDSVFYKLKSHQSFAKVLLLCTATALLSHCNYAVNLNNKTVYTPPSIFKNYQIADQSLHNCVEQTLFDKHITRAEDLTVLNCSNAGIKSLAGVDTFFALKELNLAENQISDISAIGKLGQLTKLILRKNALTETEPLLHLLHLTDLDVSENPISQCKNLAQLKNNYDGKKLNLTLPTSCI